MTTPPSPATPPDARVPVARRCMGCGYDLGGSANEGTCPECGQQYDPKSVSPFTRPGAVFLSVVFLWPAFAHLALLPFVRSRGDLIAWAGGSLCILMLLMLNSLFVAGLLAPPAQWLPPGARETTGWSLLEGLKRRRPLAANLFLVTLIAPALLLVVFFFLLLD